jgi:hypothetical protein
MPPRHVLGPSSLVLRRLFGDEPQEGLVDLEHQPVGILSRGQERGYPEPGGSRTPASSRLERMPSLA